MNNELYILENRLGSVGIFDSIEKAKEEKEYILRSDVIQDIFKEGLNVSMFPLNTIKLCGDFYRKDEALIGGGK